MPDAVAILGDELLEKGDPLGEIIALARVVEAGHADAAELVPRLVELQRDYERAWFYEPNNLYTRWEHGFLTFIEIETDQGQEFVEGLAKIPAARFLQQLDLAVRMKDRRSSWIDPEDTTDPLPHLAQHGLPKTLRRLRLAIELATYSDRQPVNLAPLWPRFRELTELAILFPTTVGHLDMPELTSLTLESFAESTLTELATAQLPALEKLTIDETPWTTLSALDPIDLPNLIELRVPRYHYGATHHAEFEALARASIVQRARRLDFSTSVTRETADALIAIAPRLPNAEQIVVFSGSLDASHLQDLTRALGSRLVVE